MMLPVVLCVQGEHLSQLDMATGYGNIKSLHCASSMGKLHTGIPGLLPTGRVGFIIHPYKVVQQMARSVILRLVPPCVATKSIDCTTKSKIGTN